MSLILSYMFSDLDAQLTKWEEIIAQKHTSSSKLRELEQRCSMLEREKVHELVDINAMIIYSISSISVQVTLAARPRPAPFRMCRIPR